MLRKLLKNIVRMGKLILLVFVAAFINPAEAFFWKLSNEQEQICRKWAARESNQFSANKTYSHCKNNIKREEKINARNEKIFEKCMGNFQEEHDLTIAKAKKLLKHEKEKDKDSYSGDIDYGTIARHARADMEYNQSRLEAKDKLLEQQYFCSKKLRETIYY